MLFARSHLLEEHLRDSELIDIYFPKFLGFPDWKSHLFEFMFPADWTQADHAGRVLICFCSISRCCCHWYHLVWATWNLWTKTRKKKKKKLHCCCSDWFLNAYSKCHLRFWCSYPFLPRLAISYCRMQYHDNWGVLDTSSSPLDLLDQWWNLGKRAVLVAHRCSFGLIKVGCRCCGLRLFGFGVGGVMVGFGRRGRRRWWSCRGRCFGRFWMRIVKEVNCLGRLIFWICSCFLQRLVLVPDHRQDLAHQAGPRLVRYSDHSMTSLHPNPTAWTHSRN